MITITITITVIMKKNNQSKERGKLGMYEIEKAKRLYIRNIPTNKQSDRYINHYRINTSLFNDDNDDNDNM